MRVECLGHAFECEITNPRLYGCFDVVVNRLPFSDWAELVKALTLVTDAPGWQSDGVKAAAVPGDGGKYSVHLSPWLGLHDANFICGVIAHELSHVRPGHSLKADTAQTEREADEQTARWGFQSDGLRRHRQEQYLKGLVR
jgi:hypothetical protein